MYKEQLLAGVDALDSEEADNAGALTHEVGQEGESEVLVDLMSCSGRSKFSLLAWMGASNGQGRGFPRGARDPFGQLPSGVPHVPRRRISCSRQSTDRTQRTPHNLLDEFRWARAFRHCRGSADLLASAYLMRLAGCPLRPERDRVHRVTGAGRHERSSDQR